MPPLNLSWFTKREVAACQQNYTLPQISSSPLSLTFAFQSDRSATHFIKTVYDPRTVDTSQAAGVQVGCHKH